MPKKRNYTEFTSMVGKLHAHMCSKKHPNYMISGKACEVMSDVIKLFIRRVVSTMGELLLSSKHMQAHTTTKVLPAINLLFPRVNPITLKPLYGEATILDEILRYATKGMARYRKNGKDERLFIRPVRVRRLMERGLVRNKKVVRTKTGTRTAQTSIPETSPVFLAYVVQAFVMNILRQTITLAEDAKRLTVKAKHVHQVVRTDRDLLRFFSGVVFAGGHVMPTIHSARVFIE